MAETPRGLSSTAPGPRGMRPGLLQGQEHLHLRPCPGLVTHVEDAAVQFPQFLGTFGAGRFV